MKESVGKNQKLPFAFSFYDCSRSPLMILSDSNNNGTIHWQPAFPKPFNLVNRNQRSIVWFTKMYYIILAQTADSPLPCFNKNISLATLTKLPREQVFTMRVIPNNCNPVEPWLYLYSTHSYNEIPQKPFHRKFLRICTQDKKFPDVITFQVLISLKKNNWHKNI